MCILPDDQMSSTSSLSSNNMWSPLLSTDSDLVFGPTLEDLGHDLSLRSGPSPRKDAHFVWARGIPE